ncbi:MAG: hypothetical protein M1829_003703 [Trizodia sp. TS-e1964]|nr:MAG: hypothetical protein M1829_003703 [Trizodia sp. TS-e1964]
MRFLSDASELRLDIVGFVAILGEGSILSNAQTSSFSLFTYLPRLLPAPQALLRPTRPVTLPNSPGTVIGTHSGNIRHQVNHIARILHPPDSLPAYAVRAITLAKTNRIPTVRPAAFGPLTFAALLGCAMSIALVVLSIHYEDGTALSATLILSCLSSVIGYGSKWQLKLQTRCSPRDAPPGDVVIQYPQGSFLIVRCSEAAARELYFAPETCIYNVPTRIYRAVALIATLMLMFGVIFLANSTLELQIAFGVSYMILNALYWAIAALPETWHWDLKSYKVTPLNYRVPVLSTDPPIPDEPEPKKSELHKHQGNSEHHFGEHFGEHFGRYFQPWSNKGFDPYLWTPQGSRNHTFPIRRRSPAPRPPTPTIVSYQTSELAYSFTGALWRAIALTGSTEWVRKAGTAPETNAWHAWLQEADAMLHRMDSSEGSVDSVVLLGADAGSQEIQNTEVRPTERLEEGDNVRTLPAWDFQGRLTTLLSGSSSG